MSSEGGNGRRATSAPYRTQEVAFALAKRVLDQQFNTSDDRRPWLFPRLVDLCRWWIDNKVVVADGYSLGHLMAITESQVLAAEKISDAIAEPGRGIVGSGSGR